MKNVGREDGAARRKIQSESGFVREISELPQQGDQTEQAAFEDFPALNPRAFRHCLAIRIVCRPTINTPTAKPICAM